MDEEIRSMNEPLVKLMRQVNEMVKRGPVLNEDRGREVSQEIKTSANELLIQLEGLKNAKKPEIDAILKQYEGNDDFYIMLKYLKSTAATKPSTPEKQQLLSLATMLEGLQLHTEKTHRELNSVIPVTAKARPSQ